MKVERRPQPGPAGAPAPPPEETPAAAEPPPPPRLGTLFRFDLLLAAGVVILGFVLGSFAVRNSDFWQHLAAGRLLAAGKFEFGKDPFSYSGTDRLWVDHSWLYDLLLYGAYSLDGEPHAAVVVVKSLALAAVALVLLLTRPRGRSLWWWALCVGLALLAMAPRLLLQPTIASFFFLAVTMFLILRVPAARGSWRLPAAVAVTFALWSNSDAWFVLGPFALGLYLLGELLQSWAGPAEESRPDLGNLALAFGTGVLACMVNPYHYHVWALPPELGFGPAAEALRADPYFKFLFLTPFDRGYYFDWDGSHGGNYLNALAFAALFLLGAFAVGVNLPQTRWGHVAVWAGFALLALRLTRGVPFFAVAAAPITALYASAFAASVRAGPLRPGPGRLLATARLSVRVFALLAGLGLLAIARPGWLHPQWRDPHNARWVAWGVEPDPSLAAVAGQIQRWREGGKLTPEAHGFHSHPDLANYCAWFAPLEKTFFDGRLEFHAPETRAYVLARRALADNSPPRPGVPPAAENADVAPLFREYGVAYLAVGGPSRRETFAVVEHLWTDSAENWPLWDVAGRACVFGWGPQKTLPADAFRALRFDAVARAFGPDVPPLPKPTAIAAAPKRTPAERFLYPPTPLPPQTDEAAVLLLHYQLRFQRALHATAAARSAAAGPAAAVLPTPIPAAPDLFALPVLILRAARTAITVNPDVPEPYFQMAQAHALRHLLEPPEVRDYQILVNLERGLARTPPREDQFQAALNSFQRSAEVMQKHQQANRADLAMEYYDLALSHLRRAIELLQHQPPADLAPSEVGDQLRFLGEQLKRLEGTRWGRKRLPPKEFVEEQMIEFDKVAGAIRSPLERARRAQQAGLYLVALKELQNANLAAASPQDSLAVVSSTIDILLLTGQVAEAFQTLRDRTEELGEKWRGPEAQLQMRDLHKRIAYLAGDLSEARQDLEAEAKQAFGHLPEAVRQAIRTTPHLNDVPMPNDLQFRIWSVFQGLGRPAGGDPTGTRSLIWMMSMEASANYLRSLVSLRELLRQEADAQIRLGLCCLEDGDTKAAAWYFRNALRPEDVPLQYPGRDIAEEYLRFLPRP